MMAADPRRVAAEPRAEDGSPPDCALAPAVEPDPLDQYLALRHPLAGELARLRIDQLEAVLDAFEALSAPHRRSRRDLAGRAHDFAVILDAVRAELRAALARRRLDPIARVVDPVAAAWEEQVAANYEGLQSANAQAAWDRLQAAAGPETRR